jgi:predicted nucleic acid-binding protein
MLTIPNLCVFDSEYVKRAIAFARSKKRSYPDAYIAVVATDKNIGVATFNERHFDDMTLYPFAD